MLDKQHTVIYVGKARNLKKRVSSYFQKTSQYSLNTRIANLVKQIHSIQVIITANESEALLLENQLIKQYQPKYNILLRDDKSYPWLILSSHPYPRLSYFRHQRKVSNDLFGPYPDSHAVYKTIKLIQAIFRLRTCKDSFFNHRSRPCLLYQLKKCSAPCTGMITLENYHQDVNNARLLLQGKNQLVINQLVLKMQKASADQAYELASQLRDQIIALRHIQTDQIIKAHAPYNLDAIVVMTKQQKTVIGLLSIRQGNITGNQIFYPEILFDSAPAEILSAFISQYYANNNANVKMTIILKQTCKDKIFLKKALGIKVIVAHQKADYIKYLKMAEKTAEQALDSFLSAHNTQQVVLQQLKALLQLANPIVVIMCVDISHTAGESTVGACVVFDQKTGFCKKFYRRFNIGNIQLGDDYAGLSQVITRYFQRENLFPDLLLIDGGKGQLSAVNKALQVLKINNINLLGISKGPARKSGEEKFFLIASHDSQQIVDIFIPSDDPVFHLLQKIRDEAHRFAIGTHRKQRAKIRKTSILETITGIGPKKRQALLSYLGGLQAIKKASIEQLKVVPGIHQKLAEKIHQLLQH